MQKYINYLISDMQEIAQNIPPKQVYFNDTSFDIPDYIIELEQAPLQKMLDIFCIDKYVFPHSEKLDDKQLKELVSAIEQLWKAYNFYPVYPENLPVKRKYELLVEKLDGDKVQYISEGRTHIEFCWYEPEHCPFGWNYCECKYDIEEWEQEAKDNGIRVRD